MKTDAKYSVEHLPKKKPKVKTAGVKPPTEKPVKKDIKPAEKTAKDTKPAKKMGLTKKKGR